MRIMYINEHKACEHYINDYHVGFSYCKTKAKNSFRIHNQDQDCIVFLLSGVLKVETERCEETLVDSCRMFFIAQNEIHVLTAVTEVTTLQLLFNNKPSVCDKFFLKNMAKGSCCVEFYPLRILPVVNDFLQQMVSYIDSEMFCRHMHDLKQTEYIFLLRAFYAREELVRFFSPLLTSDLDFRGLVLMNYTKSKSVKELASKLNMGLRTFERKFKETFHEAPSRWMNRQKGMRIGRDLANSDLSIADLIQKYEFSSAAHFTTYCKKVLGDTPTAIRCRL